MSRFASEIIDEFNLAAIATKYELNLFAMTARIVVWFRGLFVLGMELGSFLK